MALIKYNPILAPSTFSNLVDRLFTDVYSDENPAISFSPEVDLSETEKEYEIHVSLPGFKKEDIAVDVKDNYITISGERKFVKEDKKYHTVESSYGKFQRSFRLPATVNENNISAKFNNGILEVKLGKDEKKVLSHKVEIK
ncbi:MAG: Hsp20/alpha crystallin family protein [Bacteroidota bacterium]|nr:Hsp20/alpha crystallin family protein [Bacteroidota bacterium]